MMIEIDTVVRVLVWYAAVGSAIGWFMWLVATQDGGQHSLMRSVLVCAFAWPLVLLTTALAIIQIVWRTLADELRRPK